MSPTAIKVLVGVGERESNGKYNAIGTITKSGDRAYGKYQVMGNNIPHWTKRYLGKEMTPDQFMNDPLAQELLAGMIFTERIGKHQNIHDPVALWFSGQPLANNNAMDITGTSVPEYVRDVLHITKAYASE